LIFLHIDSVVQDSSGNAGNSVAAYTTAANYEAYLNYCEKYGETRDGLITMCGAGLKSDH
jgi:threonine synthase